MRRFRLGLAACGLMAMLLPACAGGSDAKSRQLIAISHRASSPNGALAISDDGSYAFLDSDSKTESRGDLSSSEFEAVKARVSSPGLEQLYEHSSEDGDACGEALDGYFLVSRVGSSCFTASTLTEQAAQEHLAFFTDLFTAKSGENK